MARQSGRGREGAEGRGGGQETYVQTGMRKRGKKERKKDRADERVVVRGRRRRRRRRWPARRRSKSINDTTRRPTSLFPQLSRV